MRKLEKYFIYIKQFQLKFKSNPTKICEKILNAKWTSLPFYKVTSKKTTATSTPVCTPQAFCLFILITQTFFPLLPSPLTLRLCHSSPRLVFGNSNGLAVVDYVQKTVVLNLGTVELYGSNDPYQRQPRSPRKARQPSGGNNEKGIRKTPGRKAIYKP